MSTDTSLIPTETINSGSAPSSAPGSPKNRVKFLCSHGGKILPRPSDGHLKYVGGETRVISVSRNISFHELMKKLTYPTDGEMILKYQVVSEDLDALVSVKSNDDVRYMCDEIDRYEHAGAPRLRAFLFPTNPTILENQISAIDHYALEQRYIDAVNGITRSTPKQHPMINSLQHGSLQHVSSGCTSPRSPDSCTTEAIINNEPIRTNMHRVKSSPSICGLNAPHQNSHHVNQLPPQYVPNYHGHLSSKQVFDLHKSVGTESRLVGPRSVSRAEGVRYHVDPTAHYYYVPRQNRGSGCIHYNECGRWSDRRMVDRVGVRAMSSVPSSPRFRHG